ncbi:MAG: hypothetical protein IKD85_03000 [Firmicutes bacterium]|jgi:hypothetical protein|nr:hypothetical protein [Bacillota bacterium]
MVLKILLTIMMAVPIVILGGYLLDKLMEEALSTRKKTKKKRRRNDGIELRNSYEYRSSRKNNRRKP